MWISWCVCVLTAVWNKLRSHTHTPPTRFHASEGYCGALSSLVPVCFQHRLQHRNMEYLEVKGIAESRVGASIDHFQTTLWLLLPHGAFKYQSQLRRITCCVWKLLHWAQSHLFSYKWDNETICLFIPQVQARLLNWWFLPIVGPRNVSSWEIMRHFFAAAFNFLNGCCCC